MKFPLAEVLCFIIGWVFSGCLLALFSKFVKKHNIGLARLLKHLPETIGGLIAIPLILLLAVPFCCMFTWCKVAYDYFIANNITNALLTFLFNILCCFYTSVITKDMPERRRR